MTRTSRLLLLPFVASTTALIQPATSPGWSPPAPQPTGYRLRVVAQGLPGPAGLAVRNEALFVALRPGPGAEDGALVRLDLATRRLTLLLTGPDAPTSFAVDRASEVLWTSDGDGSLWGQARPGTAPRALRSRLGIPSAVAVDEAQSVYWVEDRRTDRSPDSNGVLSLGGGRVRLVLSSGARPTALAVSPQGDIYWTNEAEGLLHRVLADGRKEVLLRGLRRPTAIALSPDARTVFFTEVPTPGRAGEAGGANTVSALHLDTFSRTLVAHGDPDPAGLAAAEGGRVYWSVTSRGLVMEAVPEFASDALASARSRDKGPTKFRATLGGLEETPPVATTATGSARFDLKAAKRDDDDLKARHEGATAHRDDDDEGEGEDEDEDEPDDRPYLKFKVKAKDLFGFTAAHIHAGAAGQPGPVVAPLPFRSARKFEKGEIELEGKIRPADLTGPLAGDWDGFVAALSGGGLYVNLHTSTNPGGEIRGQILTKDGPGLPNAPPNGTITSPPGDVTITAGTAVTFAGATSDPNGDPVNVFWDFGDGGTSTELVPGPHVYTTPGTFVVSFTATDSAGLADPTPDEVVVTVIPEGANAPPDGTITSPAGDVTILAGQSVTFAGVATDPDGDMITVHWDFGDGSTSTELIPGDHVYASAGTYLVTLTATDSNGLSDPTPDSRTVTVQPVTANEPPNGTILAPPGDVTITEGESVSFAGTATDPNGDTVTVLWSFGDGSSSTALVPGDHAYPAAGTYLVTFTATDATGLSDPTPDTRTITVTGATPNQAPDGTITNPAGAVTITAGESVTFSGIATDPDGDTVTVLWDFGDGETSTALMPGAHVYASPGTYLVLFTATDSEGLSDPTPDTRSITVNPAAPSATLTMVQSVVFTPKCTGCHGGSSPTAGLNLEAGAAYANLVNVPATTEAGTRVVPGQPQNSVLYTFLVAGHRSSSVTDADRQLIFDWITAGAPDN